MTEFDQLHFDEPRFLNFNWTKSFLTILNTFNDSARSQINCVNLDEGKYTITQASQCGILSALIIIFILEKILFKRATEERFYKNKFVIQWPSFINLKSFLTVSALVFFVILSPILLTVVTCFYFYKNIVTAIIRLKYRGRFVRMMNGADSVWAIEEDNARSVINVVCLTKSTTLQTSDHNLIENIRKIMCERLSDENSAYSKLLYTRAYDYGFHFWLSDKINVGDFVKPIDAEMDEDELQEFVSEHANEPLPLGNTFTWEINVGLRPLKNSGLFPILFRIHHSLGDGVALLKLFLDTIGVQHNNCRKPVESNNHVNIGRLARILYKSPVSLLNQILRPADSNAIHGPVLSGRKTIAWISDDAGLLGKIKRLKKRIPDMTFSNLLLSALSASCQKYFEMKSETVGYITAVVPVRMDPKPSKALENRFSVAMLTIPMNKTNPSMRLCDVKTEMDELRTNSDFYVNYWLMNIAGSILPEIILKPMMESVQATLVVSNLPGPSEVVICDDYHLEKIVFFVPHRGTTGIGITVISCDDTLHLGIMADSALISERTEAQYILKNIVTELETLDDTYSTKSHKQREIR